MESKRVLNIIQRYHPAKGGAELFIKLLSEYQHGKLGFEVDVWTTDVYDSDTLWDLEGDIIEEKQEIINGVNVYRYPVGHGILKNKYINKVFRVVFSKVPNFSISNLATCPTTFDMLRKTDEESLPHYDYVTVSSTPYFFLFYVGYLVSKKLNVPYIIAPALHTGKGMENKYLPKTSAPFYEHATKIIVNTKSEEEKIKSFCLENGIILDNEKFQVLGQGVFLNQIQGGDGKRFREKYGIEDSIVFQVGSKNFEKGNYSLVEAMKILWDNGVKANLVFAGLKNEDFSRYIDSQEEKYKENILNIDNVSDEEKWDLFAAGDVFSMISKTDSFGIVYLEAWTYSKPVLGCRNDVMREVISDNEDGFLIEFDNVKEISRKILFLLENDNLRKEMGANGRRKVETRYNWDTNLSALDEIYRK